MALRKAENSEFCSFAKFGRVWLSKFGIFSEIIGSFVIAKVSGSIHMRISVCVSEQTSLLQ